MILFLLQPMVKVLKIITGISCDIASAITKAKFSDFEGKIKMSLSKYFLLLLNTPYRQNEYFLIHFS